MSGLSIKKSILFLTDVTNGELEDLITVDYLKKDFDITISYFNDIEKIEENFDLIVLRNTWPADESKFEIYNRLKKNFFERTKKKSLKIYNDINANCDRLGKDYLVELYKYSLPVIPSVSSLDDVDALPEVDEYLAKPKDGFSAIGIETIKKNDLSRAKLDNYIIQPKLNFQHEISFYFVDSQLLYCLIFEPSKVPHYPKPRYYKPTEEEIQFARQFMSWNKMRFGVCRIDALKTDDEKLLLLEIEDDSPYFSITEIDEMLKNLFLEKMKQSVEKVLYE